MPARVAEELVKSEANLRMSNRGRRWSISLKLAAAVRSAVCAVNLPLIGFSGNWGQPETWKSWFQIEWVHYAKSVDPRNTRGWPVMNADVYHPRPSSEPMHPFPSHQKCWLLTTLTESFPRNYQRFVESSSIQSYVPSLWVTCSQWLVNAGTQMPVLFASVGATHNSEVPTQFCCNCIVVNFLSLPNPALLIHVCCSQLTSLLNCLHVNLHFKISF